MTHKEIFESLEPHEKTLTNILSQMKELSAKCIKERGGMYVYNWNALSGSEDEEDSSYRCRRNIDKLCAAISGELGVYE